MVAEETRIQAVLHDANMQLNVGQFHDVEALNRAINLGLVERNYAGVHMLFQMLALPKIVLTDKAFDWLEENGLEL